MRVCECLIYLGIARFCVSFIPPRYYLDQKLFKNSASTQQTGTIVSDPLKIEQVSNTLKAVARYAPWQSSCIVKAIAASWMLRRRRCAYELYFGLNNSENRMRAHALAHFIRQICYRSGGY